MRVGVFLSQTRSKSRLSFRRSSLVRPVQFARRSPFPSLAYSPRCVHSRPLSEFRFAAFRIHSSLGRSPLCAAQNQSGFGCAATLRLSRPIWPQRESAAIGPSQKLRLRIGQRLRRKPTLCRCRASHGAVRSHRSASESACFESFRTFPKHVWLIRRGFAPFD
jgi:hypothetical protein